MSIVSTSMGGTFEDFSFFEVELGLGKRAKRATCRAIYGTGIAGSKPRSGEILTIDVDGSQVFRGPIHTVGDQPRNPDTYEVTAEATGWTPFLDAKLVHTENEDDPLIESGALIEQTLNERVTWILDKFCPGFTLGTVDNNETLAAQAIDRRPASEVFDELAELTDQVFDLSFNKVVEFLQSGDTAPIAAVNVDSDLTVDSVQCVEDWSDLHNVLLIKDFKLRSAYSYEEKFTADGQQSFFKLSMPPWSVNETIVSVSKDGGAGFTDRVSVVDSLGNQSEWEIYRGEGDESETNEHDRLIELEEERQAIIKGTAGEAYICLWNQGIRFPTDDLPGNGDVIRVRYPFERPQQTLEVRDLSSIAEIKSREGTDGIHQKVINIPELRAVSLESAVDYASVILQRGAWPVLTGSFHTYVPGWAAGQQFTISSSIRGIHDPRPPYDVANVWVSRVLMTCAGIDDDGTALVDHTVEFTSLPYAVPISMDEMIWRLIDRTSWLRPPGNIPTGTDYTTSTSTSTTTTVTSTSTSTTTMTVSSTSTSTTLWPGEDSAVRAQVMFCIPGTLSVDDDQAPWYICSILHHLTLLDTNLVVKTAPTGAAIEIDIQRSPDCGHTWWSIYSTKPTIAAGSMGDCDGSGTLSDQYICEGDLLRLDVTQVGSTVAGADLTVSLVVRQGVTGTVSCPSGTSTSTTQTGTSTSTTTTLWQWESPVAIQACSGYEAGYPPENMIDGDTGTAWMHFESEDHDVVFDLGTTRDIKKIRLYVYPMTSSQWCFFQLYISDDLLDWGSPVLSSSSLMDGEYGAEWVQRSFGETSGRYLWLTLIDTEHDDDYIAGAEFEVYVKVVGS